MDGSILDTGHSVQSHLTFALPIKSLARRRALEHNLPTLALHLSKAADSIGTLHYFRFVVLSKKTLLFLADFDGEFEKLVQDLAQHAGPVFDAVLEYVNNPPPVPVAGATEAFAEWAARHQINPIAVYTAFPGATVQKVKSRAAGVGIAVDGGSSQQIPFQVILPIKSHVSLITVEMLLRATADKATDALNHIGTVHSARFVRLENNQIGFFAVYDGPFDKYIHDFAGKLGPVFDLLFKFVIDPPPTPSARNADALTKWVAAHSLPRAGFYAAYPGLRVQDVNNLLADALVAQR